MMVGSLAWPGSGWLWLGVLGLGAVCALTVVTVSTVHTAITRWSPNTPPAQHSQPPGLTRSHVRSMPGWPCHMTAAITAYIAVSAAHQAKLYAARLVTQMVKHQTHY